MATKTSGTNIIFKHVSCQHHDPQIIAAISGYRALCCFMAQKGIILYRCYVSISQAEQKVELLQIKKREFAISIVMDSPSWLCRSVRLHTANSSQKDSPGVFPVEQYTAIWVICSQSTTVMFENPKSHLKVDQQYYNISSKYHYYVNSYNSNYYNN